MDWLVLFSVYYLGSSFLREALRQALPHRTYLERPRSQLDTYYRPGSRRMVYGLGNKVGNLSNDESAGYRKSSWSEKNRSVGRMFLEHALLVSDVMVAKRAIPISYRLA